MGGAADLRLPQGCHRVFGALQRARTSIEFIQVRHEEMAAFIATARAKFTGGVRVCIATSGPGAAHLVTDLDEPRLDPLPVLAIAGSRRAPLGGHYQQEIDVAALLQGGTAKSSGLLVATALGYYAGRYPPRPERKV